MTAAAFSSLPACLPLPLPFDMGWGGLQAHFKHAHGGKFWGRQPKFCLSFRHTYLDLNPLSLPGYFYYNSLYTNSHLSQSLYLDMYSLSLIFSSQTIPPQFNLVTDILLLIPIQRRHRHETCSVWIGGSVVMKGRHSSLTPGRRKEDRRTVAIPQEEEGFQADGRKPARAAGGVQTSRLSSQRHNHKSSPFACAYVTRRGACRAYLCARSAPLATDTP